MLETLDHDLRFWEVEELPSTSRLSPEDQECEEHFKRIHIRTKQGRYVVRLPFKSTTPVDLGDLHAIATSSLLRLERRLLSDAEKRSAYRDFMTEYEDLGHIIRLVPHDHSPPYVPYYCIYRTTRFSVRAAPLRNSGWSSMRQQ